jgi:hypothetical protein
VLEREGGRKEGKEGGGRKRENKLAWFAVGYINCY